VTVDSNVASDPERPVVPKEPCLMCEHDYCQCRTDQAAWDFEHFGELPVLGRCPHGIDLDREFCPQGCRV
jgi:hypothetical protein